MSRILKPIKPVSASMFITAFLLSGCAAVVAGGAAAGGYLLGKDERSLEQIATDAKITTRVKSALIRNDQIRALNINVDTYNGRVILHGQVENSREQDLAITLASGTKGVKSVESNLKVVPVKIGDLSQ